MMEKSTLQESVLLTNRGYVANRNYWLNQLAGAEKPAILPPFDPAEASVDTYRSFGLTPEATEGLRKVCRNDTALYLYAVACLGVLMHRCWQAGRATVGCPPFPDGPRDGEPGEWSNPVLPVTLALDGSLTVKALLMRVQTTVADAARHQHYPLHKIYAGLGLGGSADLFDVILTSEALHGPGAAEALAAPVRLSLTAGNGTVGATVAGRTDAAGARVVNLLADLFEHLFGTAFRHLDVPVGDLALMDEPAERQLLAWGNAPVTAPPPPTPLGLFGRQAAAGGEAIALACEDRRLSYRQLDEAAGRLAGYLGGRLGVRPGDRVGVFVPRCEYLPVALLAVWRAGAVYVPLDEALPEARTRFMLTDAGVTLVLTYGNGTGNGDLFGVPAADLGQVWEHVQATPPADSHTAPGAGQTAYVIYTSGSSGQPKGVAVSHGNLGSFLAGLPAMGAWGAGTAMPLLASPTFDISLFQLLAPLVSGGRVLLPDGETILDPGKLVAALRSATAIDTVPALFRQLVRYAEAHGLTAHFEGVTHLYIGGDRVSDALLADLARVFPRATITVTYGPTEGTIFCTWIAYPNAEARSGAARGSILGRPMPGASLYVTDPQGKLLPAGLYGEIAIGGRGVSQGYLNQDGLTAEKFREDPCQAGGRLYLSGDLGRWTPDGTLEFAGRRDSQVKVRGFRIEVAEIEAALLRHPSVESAVVVARRDADEGQSLAAYFTGRDEGATAPALRTFLAASLPAYMVPAHLVRLARLPVTPNGKVDYKQLPEPPAPDASSAGAPPANPLEAQLATIYAEVLGRPAVGVHDNFFESGGHSLSAVNVLALVYARLGVNLNLRSFFTNPTVASLARVVRETAPTGYEPIAPAPLQEWYELSHAQKRLWLIDQMGNGQAAYNMPGALRLKGRLDRGVLERTVAYLVARHESLRTAIGVVDGEPKQKVYPPEAVPVRVAYLDLGGAPDQAQRVRQLLADEINTPFDLAACPLFRAKLVRLADDLHLFSFNMHHIVSDGWSMRVLSQELTALYNAFLAGREAGLAPLRIGYKDYAHWHRQQLTGERLEAGRQYWLDRLGGEIPVLDLPTDGERRGDKTYRGGSIGLQLDRAPVAALEAYGHRQGASLFMSLLAVINALFYRYTGQEDLIIGSPVAGRDHQDLAGQVGFYVNTVALRTTFSGGEGFDRLLDRVREAMLGAYEHQGYPFDLLVDELEPERITGRAPLFDVMVTLQRRETAGADDLEGIATEMYDADEIVSKFDLAIYFIENDEGLFIRVEYDRDLFTKARIERMLTHFAGLIGTVPAHPAQPLHALPYQSPAERQLLAGLGAGPAACATGLSVAELFEAQAARTPWATALVSGGRTCTYRQLNEQANQLAHLLRRQYGLQPDDRVGILVPRTEWVVVSVLAVLKAGAAFVPIHDQDPAARIDYVLRDSGCKVLLLTAALRDLVPGNAVPTLALDEQAAALAAESTANIPHRSRPGDLAYVIYTSGSTGKPKGVMIEQGSVVNLVEGLKTAYAYHPGWKFIFTSSIAFDAAVKQILVPLTIGAQVHVAPDPRDLKGIAAYLAAEGIQVMHASPLVWQGLLGELRDAGLTCPLQFVSWGGDKMGRRLAAELKSFFPEATLVNTYGPTEVCINATHYQVHELPGEDPPIGKPLPGYQVYILDPYGNPAPVGVKGEICVGGAGLARAYLNRPDLTAERFIANPFDGAGRLYKTGDAGAWTEDGNVRFFGRIDDQVKIRGYRVELGEVEAALRGCPGVESALATVHGSGEDPRIIAYLVLRKRIVLRPSWAEQFVYDDMAYYAMMNDTYRNERYQRAFDRVLRDKVVLEVGPGSEAVLSLMCVQAGARRVYAVEILQESYEKAKRKVAALGLSDRVILMHGDVTGVTLPEPVDYCVSEIVGSIGGSQGAAKIMNHTRRLLADPACVIPRRSVTRVAAVTLPESDFTHGFDAVGAHYLDKIFEKVGRAFDLRLCLHNFPPGHVVSGTDDFETLDYALENPSEASHPIVLEMQREAVVHGCIAWLQLHVDEHEVIDTLGQENLWLPLYFPLFPEGVAVRKGDYIAGTVSRQLSADGVHPDYTLMGTLYAGGTARGFVHHSYNEAPFHRESPFYERLFAGAQARVTENTNLPQVREALAQLLPEYMMPAHFEVLDAFPLTPQGKLDRKALPVPAAGPARPGDAPPRDAWESGLAAIWREVLELDAVGIHDDFFAIGGHSLKAVKVMSRIFKTFDVQVSVGELFRHRTVSQLAEVIARTRKARYREITPTPERAYYEVSHAQRRLWIIDQLDEKQTALNMPGAYRFRGDLRPAALERAFRTLVARHESLRTRIVTIDNQPKQQVCDPDAFDFRIPLLDYSGAGDPVQRAQQAARAEADLPFDLGRGPLVRAKLLRIGEADYVLLLTMHHIVSDAWSMEVLVNEIAVLYAACCEGRDHGLSPLRIQYRDYAAWQHDYLAGPEAAGHRAYWLGRFAGEIPCLSYRHAVNRPALKTYGGLTTECLVSPAARQGLEQVGRQGEASLFMVLLASVKAMLYCYSGQEDLVVGTPVAGRDHLDLEGQIGFYVNMLAIRTGFHAGESFATLLAAVKENTLGAFTHAAYPFDLLVHDLNLQRDMSHLPLFDVGLNYYDSSRQDQLRDGNLLPRIELDSFDFNPELSVKGDIWFNVYVNEQDLRIAIDFNVDLFDQSFREAFTEGFGFLLGQAAATPALPVAALGECMAAHQAEWLRAKEKALKRTNLQRLKTTRPAG